MDWTLTDDIDAYAAAVNGLLASQPERHTVLLSVLANLIKHGPTAYGDDPPVLGWWSADGTVRAAALRTPPHPLQVTSLPGQSARQLAATLAAGSAAGLTEVLGAESDAGAFASAWCALTGAEFVIKMRQRLYRLGELSPPDPMPPGAGRLATAADAKVALDWHAAFGAETGQRGSATSLDALEDGRVALWEVAGEPVSMATVTPVICGVARIGQVYTPPAGRRQGYGGAVTVAATRVAQERGAASVILFTDLANPTSNALYRRLGYRPVEDKVLIGLSG